MPKPTVDPRRPGASRDLLLYQGILGCSVIIRAVLNRRLQHEFDSTLARLEVMAYLNQTPCGSSMTELSKCLMVTRSNMTAIVRSLEQSGLITRNRDPGDYRIVRVRLTEHGVDVVTAMTRSHDRWVSELLQPMAPTQRRQLDYLLVRFDQTLTR